MLRVLLLFCIFYWYGYADPKSDRLIEKGSFIVKKVCNSDKLAQIDSSMTPEDIQKAINDTKACQKLNRRNLKAVVAYLKSNKKEFATTQIIAPHKAKCPVCGMFIYKYPHWAAVMDIDGKKYFFDGVKDMMKYYIFDGDFPYNRKDIKSMLVTDFYTLNAIDAKSAYYVIGSNVYGPMGHELIPFKDLKSAKEFMAEHNGEKIVKFDEITDKLIIELDNR